MYVDSIRSLEKIVGDWLGDIQIENYNLNYDELVGSVAEDLLNLIRDEYEFTWGDEMPEISDHEFWYLVESYELQEEEVSNERT